MDFLRNLMCQDTCTVTSEVEGQTTSVTKAQINGGRVAASVAAVIVAGVIGAFAWR